MKIIWAIPKFENPQTGGEKVFEHMAGLFEKNGDVLTNVYFAPEGRNGIVAILKNNYRNYRMLKSQPESAPIIQNLFNRSEYLLANVLLRLISKRKIILFVNEENDWELITYIRRMYNNILNYISFKSASMIVVNSNYMSKWIATHVQVRSKIFRMYPVLDSGNKIQLERKRDGRIKLLCVANIRKSKGQLQLIKAMEAMERECVVTLVGHVKENQYYRDIADYISKKRLGDKVIFKGYLEHDELLQEYAKADIFVMPTLKEGFGMSVYEAMCCGMPVITSDIGGLPELVDDGLSGVLVEPGCVESLSRAINNLIARPEYADALARSALIKAESFESVNERFKIMRKTIIN